MPAPLLLLQNINLTFGVMSLLSGAELAIGAGDRVCLVGRNGSGKSTLLRVAAGLVQPDAGYRFAQRGATINYLPQEPDLSGFATTLAYVEAGFSADAADDGHRALYLLKELGLSGKEEPASLSGGEARRAALARALAPSPDLLLDEPTNHLDLPGIEWLERELAGMRSGIVLISHDRRLLERLARTTVWLDSGITRTLNEGFKAFEPWRDAALEQEASEQHKLGRKIAMEEGLAALRRHRTAHAQSEATSRTARIAQKAKGATRDAGHCPTGGRSGRLVRPASRGRAGHLEIIRSSLGRSGFLGTDRAWRPGRDRQMRALHRLYPDLCVLHLDAHTGATTPAPPSPAPPTRVWSIPAIPCMSARAARPTRSARSNRQSSSNTASSPDVVGAAGDDPPAGSLRHELQHAFG
jgi:ABC-type nitrate/sulfonate/bicarbonate transport system ATPase subunit